MLVRLRVDDDLERCEQLARLVHELDGYPPFLPGGDLRSFLLAPESLSAWVAEDDGRILGHVALHSSSSTPVMALASEATGRSAEALGVIARLMVSPSVRRKGIGRDLLLRASTAAVERGQWPVLDVATRFKGANRLYVGCGWRPAGTVTVTFPNGGSLEEDVFVVPRRLVETRMPADEVLSLVQRLEDVGVTVWLDGGWAVDALLGEQTREHANLDIVVQQVDEPKVRQLLQAHGYRDVDRPDTSTWNFVLGDFEGHQVDVHVIAFDSDGNGLYGPPDRGVVYPAQSLTGRGSVNGRQVRCISPEWLGKFHTGYELDENDYSDVYALHHRFGVPLSEEYRPPPSSGHAGPSQGSRG